MRYRVLGAVASAAFVVTAVGGCDLKDDDGASGNPFSASSGTTSGSSSAGSTSGGTSSEGSSSGSSSGSSDDNPDAPPTYSPDAMGEVVGTNCRYDQNTRQFKFDLSIQNTSSTHTFTYSISIRFQGGETAFSDDSFGVQTQRVTVAPGKERKLTVTQGYTFTKREYYGCVIDYANKTLG